MLSSVGRSHWQRRRKAQNFLRPWNKPKLSVNAYEAGVSLDVSLPASYTLRVQDSK